MIPHGHLALVHCSCSTGHEISRPTLGHVRLPQERCQQGPAHTQIWMPSGNFRCYAWKMAKGDNSLENCKEPRVRTLGRTPASLSPCLGQWLKSDSLGWEGTWRAHTGWWDCSLRGTGDGQEGPGSFWRQRDAAEGPAGRGGQCLCMGTLPAWHPCLRKEAARAVSAPLLSVVQVFFKALY